MSDVVAGKAFVVIGAKDGGAATDAKRIAAQVEKELEQARFKSAVAAEKQRQVDSSPERQQQQAAAQRTRDIITQIRLQQHQTNVARAAAQEQMAIEQRLAAFRQQALDRHIRKQIAAQQAVRAVSSPAAMAGRRQMLMSSIGFGIEDAASVLPTMGIQGAIRAASNNVSMLLMNLGGLKLAMAGIGIIAAVQVAPVLYDMLTGSSERAERLRQKLEEVNNTLAEMARNRPQAEAALPFARTSDQAFGNSRRLQGEASGEQMKAASIMEEIRYVESQMDSVALFGGSGIGPMRVEGKDTQEYRELAAKKRELEQELRDAQQSAANKERDAGIQFRRGQDLQQVENRGRMQESQAEADQMFDESLGVKNFDAARDRAEELRQEMEKLKREYAQLLELQKLSPNDPALARQLDDAELRIGNIASAQHALRQVMPGLAAKQAAEQAQGLFERSGSEAGAAAKIEEERKKAAEGFADLPDAMRQRLEAINNLSAQRQTAQLALQQYSRAGGPTIPQVALEHGSIEAAQAAAKNSDAGETTRMVGELESIDDRMEEMVDAFREFLGQFETV